MTPVLFVISCQNYKAFPGFRLNNESYTAYAYENEVLLSEGCPAIVLDVKRDFVIKNSHESFSPYNGKKCTIINLFIPDLD